jgi:hypothetical protein
VTFPQGSVLGEVKIVMKPYSRETLQAAPAGAKLGTTSFEIAGLSGLLNKDATVRVMYSADDVAAAGGDASQLKLGYYDTAQSAWVILPTLVNTQDTTMTATTNHMGVWAVMVSSSGKTAAPTSVPTKAPLPAALSFASLIIATLILGVTIWHRK